MREFVGSVYLTCRSLCAVDMYMNSQGGMSDKGKDASLREKTESRNTELHKNRNR